MEKKFATIFNAYENVLLTKDVGMIPSGFSKLSDYDKSVLFYWDKKGDKVEEEHELLTIVPIKTKNRLIYYASILLELKKR